MSIGNFATAHWPTPIPSKAERLLGLAEQAIEQRWNVYEEMASRGPEHFHADARRER